jgi:hypothetical protein
VMADLFRQSATARAGRADAEIGRACDAIAAAYRCLHGGLEGAGVGTRQSAAASGPDRRRSDPPSPDRRGVEGGIWQSAVGSLAYPFPTCEAAAPKTDVPEAEPPRIQAINRAALAEERRVSSRYSGAARSC